MTPIPDDPPARPLGFWAALRALLALGAGR